MPGNRHSFLNATLNDFNFSSPLLFRWTESRQITSLQGTGFLGCITVISDVQPTSAAPAAKQQLPLSPKVSFSSNLEVVRDNVSHEPSIHMWNGVVTSSGSREKPLEKVWGSFELSWFAVWLKVNEIWPRQGRLKILSIFPLWWLKEFTSNKEIALPAHAAFF